MFAISGWKAEVGRSSKSQREIEENVYVQGNPFAKAVRIGDVFARELARLGRPAAELGGRGADVRGGSEALTRFRQIRVKWGAAVRGRRRYDRMGAAIQDWWPRLLTLRSVLRVQ